VTASSTPHIRCFFASDLHGDPRRYRELFAAIERERPAAVFLGGDLLPHHWSAQLDHGDFVEDVLVGGTRRLGEALGDDFPQVFLILGNDDERQAEDRFLEGDAEGLWTYLHGREAEIAEHPVFGYAHVPPTPFQLKDWERYDVSRFVDPGSVSPERGRRTVPVDPDEIRYGTIVADLETLTGGRDLERAVMLFHSPPYQTVLDRAGLDGRMVDHVPLDVHVGSIAILRFIEDRKPMLTLHGHIHESTRLTGEWRQRVGSTWCINGSHDGPELALVRFDLADLDGATRELI
jgi:Icc-related predicted phosphoesterase